MDISKFTRWLPVSLTETEILAKASELAEKTRQKEELEAEKARVMRDYREQLKKINGELSGISKVIRDKAESRNVPCERGPGSKQAEIVIVRLDTGEVLERRKMTDAEKQEELSFAKDEDGKPEIVEQGNPFAAF